MNCCAIEPVILLTKSFKPSSEARDENKLL